MASSDLPPAVLRGVGTSAIGVAVIRATETARPDPLVEDPHAAVLVEQARRAFVEQAGPEAWARIEHTAGLFHDVEHLIVEEPDGDDQVLDVVADSFRQIVLGAGLDTRAYRLPLPSDLHVFEIDLPDLFAFKEPALGGARPVCHRAIVPADLRDAWTEDLTSAGLQPGKRTLWLDEGSLPYLPIDDRLAALGRVARSSAPGSRLISAVVRVDQDDPAYRALAHVVPGDGSARGVPPDAVLEWFGQPGRRTTLHPHDEVAERHGRAGGGDPRSGYLVGEFS